MEALFQTSEIVATSTPSAASTHTAVDKQSTIKALQKCSVEDNEAWKEILWQTIIAFEDHTFQTSGRGKRPGVSFTYFISRSPSAGGRHYGGVAIPSYGNELWVTTNSGTEEETKLKKSISCSTVELGYRRAVELGGAVPGSKALGIPGGGSYVWAMLREFGVISSPAVASTPRVVTNSRGQPDPGFFFSPYCWLDIVIKEAHMGRYKKYPDAGKVISTFYASISDAYNHPSAGEIGQDGHKSINLLAEEFGISRLKVRKILITTGDVVYPETKRIQELLSAGKTKAEVCESMGMAISTLNSLRPYDKGVYNLADVSNYAENSKIYRERKAAVSDLHDHLGLPDESLWLWRCVCLFQGYPFTTSGRGSKPGVKFKYIVSKSGSAGDQHYDGESVEGYGNELWIISAYGEKREKSITRSSVDYALKIAREMDVKGPKQLKIYGASYVFSLFKRFGLV